MSNPSTLRRFFSPPTFPGDDEKTRSAYFINIIVLSNIPILLLFIFIRTVTGAEPFGTANLILAAIITILTIVWFLMKNGRVRSAGYLHITTIWLASTMIALNGSGIRGTAFTSYFVVMLMAGLLLGWRPALGFTVLSILAAFGLANAENMGVIDYIPGSAVSIAIEGTVLFLFGAIFLYLIISSLQNAVKKANANSEELRTSNLQLTQLRDDLEIRVRERTSELANRNEELANASSQIQRRAAQFEALAQVARSITSIRDLQELLPNVANLINEYYGFYHVGVFLLDEAGEYAVLVASNSPGGRRMLERRHRLKVGEQGIVGSVAGSGEPRIALNVGADAVFFNNPDLPETHSEMALPLRSGGKVIGTLDVQSQETGAFTSEDVQTLSLLADQVSLAIENARLFDESNRTLNDLQMLMRQSTREAWKRLPEQQKLLGYRYNAMGASPLEESLSLKEPGTGETADGRAETGPFVVPIELRGEVIGNLVVQSPTGSRWTDDEQDIIRAVAERVALSAENARLFEETTQRAERERLVSEITGKIRSHNDPQAMIETALQELQNALGASRVDIVPKTNGGKETKV
jgi:GAF domain-containing protein